MSTRKRTDKTMATRKKNRQYDGHKKKELTKRWP
jgi:hypothetical protein